MLNFGKKFGIFCFLDNHEYDFNKTYECIAGVGSVRSFSLAGGAGLDLLDQFLAQNREWYFGHIAYDLKNEIEDLSSLNFDSILYPNLHFFIPEIILIVSKDELKIGVYPDHNADLIFEEIINSQDEIKSTGKSPELESRFSRDEYINIIKKLQQHILRGDCYEINFCQEFYLNNLVINPVEVYKKLSVLSPNPFSAFYKYEDKYLMCASPERYLKKTGNTIISQPIKGTSKRIQSDLRADEDQKKELQQNEKERAENIMIVDLVRNDLARICSEASVNVREFLKIYSFPQVHQMVSTITGTLRESVTFSEILKATFPMGSMTGAPKKRVMELIEKYEKTKRGLFSGALGYINPTGDFDFNVVIRSLLYNESKQYLSVQAGSAITFKSIPENEYEECLVKISAMKKALE
jgi:para-aminobenzoate synthetase component 1